VEPKICNTLLGGPGRLLANPGMHFLRRGLGSAANDKRKRIRAGLQVPHLGEEGGGQLQLQTLLLAEVALQVLRHLRGDRCVRRRNERNDRPVTIDPSRRERLK